MESERIRSGRRREPTVGKLRRHRVIRATVIAVAALCLQATSASASSTLLSGYGGPGQGNQAIIGAALIGGGGGSGGSSGSESAAAGANGSAPASIVLPRTPSKTTARGRSHRSATGRRAKPTSSGAASGSNGSTRPATPAAARSTGGALGLTGSDLLYVILAFCVLVGTALLTVRLSGRSGSPAGARRRQRSG